MAAVGSWRLRRTARAVARLELPDAVFKTCPWQPREQIEIGLRQWLRCCAVGLQKRRVIGMPSHAVDEAWHGLILCTAQYRDFCTAAYGQFLHHHPAGVESREFPSAGDPMHDQLRRTVIAWSMVAEPGERCVLWDLDQQLGVPEPWGVDLAAVGLIHAAEARRQSDAKPSSGARRT